MSRSTRAKNNNQVGIVKLLQARRALKGNGKRNSTSKLVGAATEVEAIEERKTRDKTAMLKGLQGGSKFDVINKAEYVEPIEERKTRDKMAMLNGL